MLCFANNLLKLLSSGESMENALRACCKGIKIGKILIHREGDNGQQVCLFDFFCMCYVESDY
jgi:uracil phosphoribosyltransferase